MDVPEHMPHGSAPGRVHKLRVARLIEFERHREDVVGLALVVHHDDEIGTGRCAVLPEDDLVDPAGIALPTCIGFPPERRIELTPSWPGIEIQRPRLRPTRQADGISDLEDIRR